MKILVSNDDGFQSKGIIALAEAMEQIEGVSEAIVVAPMINHSGASNSLTLENPLRTVKAANGYIGVNGTPTDCVHLAVTGMIRSRIAMVVSGINEGENISDDVLYSGTIAAATEGRKLGMPSVAFSLAGENPRHYDTAARVAKELVEKILAKKIPGGTMFNVNIPDIPYSKLKGWKMTRLGARHGAEKVERTRDPRGKKIYWISPPGAQADDGPGTDYHAIHHGYVSVTPLQFDFTDYKMISDLDGWLDE